MGEMDRRVKSVPPAPLLSHVPRLQARKHDVPPGHHLVVEAEVARARGLHHKASLLSCLGKEERCNSPQSAGHSRTPLPKTRGAGQIIEALWESLPRENHPGAPSLRNGSARKISWHVWCPEQEHEDSNVEERQPKDGRTNRKTIPKASSEAHPPRGAWWFLLPAPRGTLFAHPNPTHPPGKVTMSVFTRKGRSTIWSWMWHLVGEYQLLMER